jgi:hypothetical protein
MQMESAPWLLIFPATFLTRPAPRQVDFFLGLIADGAEQVVSARGKRAM